MIRQSKLEPARCAARSHDLVEALELRGAHLEVTNALGERVEVDSGEADRGARARRRRRASATPVVAARAGRPRARSRRDRRRGVRLPERRSPARARSSGRTRYRLLDSFAGVVALALPRARTSRSGVRRRALEESDRLRRALLHSVSHDLRTPLTAIRAIAAALRGADVDAGRSATRCSPTSSTRPSGSRASSRTCSRSRGSRAERCSPSAVPVPVEELVAERDRRRADALGARPSSRSTAAAASIVDVDETMLRQVLVNLLRERRALRADGGPVKIEACGDARRRSSCA